MLLPINKNKVAGFIVAALGTTIHGLAFGNSSVPETHHIAPDKVSSYIKLFEKQFARNRLVVDGESCPLSLTELDFGDDMLDLTAECNDKSIRFEVNTNESRAENVVFTIPSNDSSFHNLPLTFYSKKKGIKIFEDQAGNQIFNGYLYDQKEESSKWVKVVFNDSFIEAGNSELKVKGNKAVLSGVLGTKSYIQIKDLIEQHPEVKTLEFDFVPGSLNDDINMHTGRLIRNAGLNTYISSTGEAYSGGVDLFAAGKVRQYQSGAKLGVHSWCCKGDKPANLLNESDKAHWSQITYFNEILINGSDFYFYTINAADFDDIHIMKKNELLDHNLVTEFLPN
ncbi:hypothetical protein MHO82_20195 [Vibrio sp. Of7-15]|uniref:hypothetical protein n=1 Tax=Vibrio sp. Of7-15 TaxID=2724879 RepID=UPI001EF378B7|nr:hypothetical protein [Vibrio sp. Of7-15]MCG7499191.1 hypothetical protein [Vibrio sp. Of7-15]